MHRSIPEKLALLLSKIFGDMTPKECDAKLTVEALSGTLEDRIAAARFLKNAVIGNPTNKHRYLALGASIPLMKCIEEVDLHPELAAHAVAALGSLSYVFSREDLNRITPALLRCLFASELGPVRAAARALKLSSCVPAFESSSLSSILATETVAARVVYLLNTSEDSIAEVCTVVVAHACTGQPQANIFRRVLVIPALVQLLWRTDHKRCIVACLNAFSSLSRYSHSIAKCLVHEHGLIPVSIPFTRSMDYVLRLAACRLLTIFNSAGLLAPGFDNSVCVALVDMLVIPAREIRTTAAPTLSQLVTASLRLQRIAYEAGAVQKLATVIFATLNACVSTDRYQIDQNSFIDKAEEQQFSSSVLCANAFTALAAVSSNFDPARDKMLTYGLLPFILRGLSHNDSSIALAALKCVQSLGRSVKIVRRDMSSERFGTVLLRLLSSRNDEIRRSASAALCNLVLEFSPLRTVVLGGGGPELLVKMLHSDDPELRTNALWSLKNLLFKADLQTKQSVMSQLGYVHLQKLCRDMQPRVRELAMTILRNLASSRSGGLKNAEVDALFAASGGNFLSILSDTLKMDSSNLNIAVQALYVVCNIAAGTEHHKASLLKSEIPQLVLHWTSHQDERARIAAVWCAINLSWKEGREKPHGGAMRGRITEEARLVTGDVEGLQPEASANSFVQGHRTDDSGFHGRSTPTADLHIFRISAQRDNETRDARVVHEKNIMDESVYNNRNGKHELSNPEFGYKWRIERLRELGFEGRLRIMVNDPHVEVQGRARAALELFGSEGFHQLNPDYTGLLDTGQLQRSPSSQSTPVLLRGSDSERSPARLR